MASMTKRRQARSISAIGSCALLTLVAGPGTATAQEPLELGTWFNHTGKGAVQVYRCMQDQSRLCGRIIWLKKTTDDSGEPLRDRRNPKASMKSRPICGLPVLGNLQPAGNKGWQNGWVYDPEKGSSYTASIRAKSESQLVMTGYKSIFSKSYTWNRAPDDLPRCGDLESVTTAAQ